MDAVEWDEKYREKPLLWSHGPNRFVAEELAALTPTTAVDVACGEGRNAIWLAEQGWEVTGVDFSPVALERAEQMAHERGVDVTWVVDDVTTWDPGRVYDLVVVSYVQLPSAEFAALMKRVVSWVAPGGRLFMVGHDRSTAGVSGPSHPDLLWTPELAAGWVAPLAIERSRRGYRSLETGEEAADTVVLARRR